MNGLEKESDPKTGFVDAVMSVTDDCSVAGGMAVDTGASLAHPRAL